MKKITIIIGVFITMAAASCGGNSETNTTQVDSSKVAVTDSVTSTAEETAVGEVEVDQSTCDNFLAIKNPNPAQLDEMIEYVHKLNKASEKVNSDNMTAEQEEEMSKILPLVEKILSCDLSEDQLKKLEE